MKTIFTLLSIVLFSLTHAQKVGLYTSIYKAHGDYNKNIDRNPVGITLNYLHPISNKLDIGAELGVAMYSNKTYNVPYQGKELEIFEEDCFWTFHLLGQYKVIEMKKSYVYFEGRFGWTTFFSSKDATSDQEEDLDEYESSYQAHGTAFNSGLALGFNHRILGSDEKGLLFDFTLGINSGSKSDYRNANENTTDLNQGNFRSLTHYTSYRIGLQYQF